MQSGFIVRAISRAFFSNSIMNHFVIQIWLYKCLATVNTYVHNIIQFPGIAIFRVIVILNAFKYLETFSLKSNHVATKFHIGKRKLLW